MQNEAILIKRKLSKFGLRSSVVKAVEEVNELLSELETLLYSLDYGALRIARIENQLICNIAEEYADVEITVFDTLREAFGNKFIDAWQKKRTLVYDERLPNLLNGEDYVE